MKKLSTGQDATLGNYRHMASLFFGEDSEAVRFLDEAIDADGEGMEVVADEGQVVGLLFEMTYKGVKHGHEHKLLADKLSNGD
jgi:hypothetical protein